MEDFDDDMEDLVSAEDFLDYFGINYEPAVVHVNRLHILQRFHDYLSRDTGMQSLESDERYDRHKSLLTQAYADFVSSDAQTEKVFKVFRMNEPQTAFVPVDELLGR